MTSHDIDFSKDFESHIRHLEEVLKKATDEAQCIIMELAWVKIRKDNEKMEGIKEIVNSLEKKFHRKKEWTKKKIKI